MIPLRVLAPEVGIDRHLRLAASADCGDEIDGGRTALMTDVLKGLVSYVQEQYVPPDPQRLRRTTFASIRLDAVGVTEMQVWPNPAMEIPASR